MFDILRCGPYVLAACALSLSAAAGACSAPSERPAQQVATAPQTSTRPSAAPTPSDPVWHYEGAEGPTNWGKLSPKFAACGEGRSQSPIDIVDPTPGGETTLLKMLFPPTELKIAHHAHVADGVNNGHTVQINYGGGDTLTIANETYTLVQYHFHNPSEHTVKGKHFPMEMHLVHKAADTGKLAVIGVLIEEGVSNAAFDPIWSNLPKQQGVETHYPSVKVDVDALLPRARTSYRYDGSLTTPPCSEGVKWMVMVTPIQLSSGQIRAFTALIHDNNRPTQPLNGRSVITDAVAVSSQ
jgi:carbonic anhydrase